MKHVVTLAILFALTLGFPACGDSGGGDPADDGDAAGGWWNGESREPAGAGAFLPDEPVFVKFTGSTTWLGFIEIAGPGPHVFPSAGDPDRTETMITTANASLIEGTSTDYSGGVIDSTSDSRYTSGATAPSGMWTANDGFFPGGIATAEAIGEYDAGAVTFSLLTYRPETVGCELRFLTFGVPALAAGTYTVTVDLIAFGIRAKSPLSVAPTNIFEVPSAGTLTITTASGTTLGSQVAGTYNLTFPGGTATGSFDVTILDVE